MRGTLEDDGFPGWRSSAGSGRRGGVLVGDVGALSSLSVPDQPFALDRYCMAVLMVVARGIRS